MNSIALMRLSPVLFGSLLFTATARANEAQLACAHTAHALAPAAIDAHDYRKYAPDREVDILHLTLDVTPDFAGRTVSGTATWKFKPIAKPFAEMKLDGIDMNVDSVTATETVLGYQVTDAQVIVTFAEPIPVGKEASVTVRYKAAPERGLYFRTPELGYKAEDMHIWTQGEPHEARFWYPSYDYPNEKFTTEMIIHVPEGITALSNGRKISETKRSNGLVAVHWLQDKPHVNYLVALVAGKLKSIEDRHGNIPMRFWTPASEIGFANASFSDTKPCMEFFEKEIGVPYPWDKYDQVCLEDYHWGGMENTTLTTLNMRTLYPPEYENLRSSQGLVAHELAHQWFGNLLTCKDWSHIWLNEGFASFYDLLYTEHKDGREEFLYRLYESQKSLALSPITNKAIVWRKFGDAAENFDSMSYSKGAWVLNMLRHQLGPELFRQAVKKWIERHQFDTVVTDDLRAVVEEVSGRSFDQFFDQWVYHTGVPKLEVDYSWDERAKLAKVSVRQTQAVTEHVPLFNVRLPVRFKGKSGHVDRVLTVKQRSEDFYFPLSEAPQIVRVDPDVSVLAEIVYRPSTAMLAAQLADKADMMGRYIAVEQLGQRKDNDSVAKLKHTLNNDGYWAVRIAASKALRAINNDAAFEALAASLKQPNARVRRQVVSDVTSFYRPEAFAQAQAVLKTEKNPDIIALALGALAPTGTNARATLVHYVNTNSFRMHLAETAFNAMRAQKDEYYIEPLRAALERRKSDMPSRTFANGLNALASLARELENKDAVREFIASHANDPKQAVKLGAITALGTLQDERALPILERFTVAAKNTPERRAAETAVETIRGTRKTSSEVGEFRREVLQLQTQNRELRRELDALKKRLDAVAVPAAKEAKKK